MEFHTILLISIVFLLHLTSPIKAGSDPEAIKSIESKGAGLHDNNFDGVSFLIQKIGKEGKPTIYYSSRTGHPVVQRCAAGDNDDGKQVIVLDVKDDGLYNYKSKDTFIVLQKREAKEPSGANTYNSMYAYVRDPLPTDKGNKISIGGKDKIIEFDSFCPRDHKKNRAIYMGHPFCYGSLFAPCKSGDPPTAPAPIKSAVVNESAHIDTEVNLNTNVKDQNNFYFDMELTDLQEKLVGGIISMLIDKIYNMNNGQRDKPKLDALAESLEYIGKLRVADMNTNKSHDVGTVGYHTLISLLDGIENNGGIGNPRKRLNLEILDAHVQSRSKSTVAGRYSDGDYGGDYGGDEEATLAINIKLGRRRRSIGEAGAVNDDNSDLKRVTRESAVTKGSPDFKTQVDLYSHLGWATQDIADADLSKKFPAQQSIPFIGFGHCPYKPVDLTKLSGLANAESAIEFYLTLLRMDCNKNFKDELLALSKTGHLSFESDKTFKVSPNCKLLKTPKLTGKETNQLTLAFEISAFSKAVKGFENKPIGPDGAPIPSRVAIVIKMALDGADDSKVLAEQHLITNVRSIALSLKSCLVKSLQDLYRLKKSCPDCDKEGVERNGALNLLAAYHFVVNDKPILEKSGSYENFKSYFKENSEAIKKRLNNYLNPK